MVLTWQRSLAMLLAMFNHTVLRPRRKDLGLTLEDLANRMCMRTVGPLSEYERGKRIPNIKTLVRLAKALRVDIGFFMAIDGNILTSRSKRSIKKGVSQ